MTRFTRFFASSIGSKVVVAVTGFGLFLFVILHMLGNLQVFLGRSALNAYAYKLQSLPLLLWAARIGLLAIAVTHVTLAIRLTLQNRAARPTRYAFKDTVQATITSRTMIWSGLLILSFVVYHLLHFTFGTLDPGTFHRTETLADGTVRHDVYAMVVLGFRNPILAVSYVVAMVLLAMHLHHGASSLFQTLGLDHPRYTPILRKVGPIAAVLIGAGNISIPLVILLGWVPLPPGVTP